MTVLKKFTKYRWELNRISRLLNKRASLTNNLSDHHRSIKFILYYVIYCSFRTQSCDVVEEIRRVHIRPLFIVLLRIHRRLFLELLIKWYRRFANIRLSTTIQLGLIQYLLFGVCDTLSYFCRRYLTHLCSRLVNYFYSFWHFKLNSSVGIHFIFMTFPFK